MAKSLASVGTFLDSHSKRDTVIRTAQFGALLLGSLSRNHLPSISEKLIKVCDEFSHARLILRLIDDMPMLAHTLKCYLSREVRVILCLMFVRHLFKLILHSTICKCYIIDIRAPIPMVTYTIRICTYGMTVCVSLA